MHLVTFERGNAERASATARSALRGAYGALEELESPPAAGRRVGAPLPHDAAGDIVDLNRALALKLALGDAGAPEAEADSLLPPEPLAFLGRFDESLVAAKSALAFIGGFAGRYDGPDLRALGVVESRRGLRLHAPVPRPGKVIGLARPGRQGAASGSRSAQRDDPVLFVKASSAVAGPESVIALPAGDWAVDCEGMLAVVIGREARNIESHEALDYIAGYTAAGDVTARSPQGAAEPGWIGKSCDGFAPLGPVLVTRDQISDPHDLALRTVVSREVVRAARTKEMLVPVPDLVSWASRLMTLEPGDVLLTGPLGGGEASPGLRDGDVVEIQIEGIGTLRSFVGRAPTHR